MAQPAVKGAVEEGGASPSAASNAQFNLLLEQQLAERRKVRAGWRWLALGCVGLLALLALLALASWTWATRDVARAPAAAALSEAELALADRAPGLTDEDVPEEESNAATDDVISEVEGEIVRGDAGVAAWQPEVRADDESGVSDEMIAAFHSIRLAPRNVSLLPRTTLGEYNVMLPGVHYLLYSPSGGWANQFICLLNAVTLAGMSGKTLVVPMHGMHSDLYDGYLRLKQEELVPMDQVIDFEHVKSRVKFLFLNITITEWLFRYTTPRDSLYQSLPAEGLSHPRDHTWFSRVERACRRRKQLVYLRGRFFTSKWLNQAALYSARIAPYLQDIAAAVADALRSSAFASLNKKEQSQPRHELPASSSRSTNSSAGRFNAIHIRLGDMKTKAGNNSARFLMNAQKYGFAKDVPLYVAAEEPRNHSYFEPLIGYFDTVVFFEDLLKIKQLHLHLVDFVLRTPNSAVRNSLAGIQEQLILVHADRFLGTKQSTWSLDVRRKRRNVKGLVPQLWASMQAEKARTGARPPRWSAVMHWQGGVEDIGT